MMAQGKICSEREPHLFLKQLPTHTRAYKRILGLDLGLATGAAFIDVLLAAPSADVTMYLGQWDLKVGDYDTGILRIVRLQQFLEVTAPDLIMFEDAKYTPPKEIVQARGLGIRGIVARVAKAAEFLGALKTAVAIWAAQHDVPAQGVSISAIKKAATGRGNSGKEAMIAACNTRFGTDLRIEDYKLTGADNMADAAHVCAMGFEQYAEGLVVSGVQVG